MRTLVETLAELIDGRAGSHQLMGEELARLSGSQLAEAGDAWRDALERTVPVSRRDDFLAATEAHHLEAYTWLRRYNRSLRRRVQGYLALGERCAFEYPWPVVAILGICQVQDGMARNAGYAVMAPFFARLGMPQMVGYTDWMTDVLRRTNRAIFADSVPTVLLALRAHTLRAAGDDELAHLLLEGPLPPTMDERTRGLARGVFDRLAIQGGRERFRALADHTLDHFEREQSIFTHHLAAAPDGGTHDRKPPPKLLQKLMAADSVSAPHIARDGREPRLVFHDVPLPDGYSMRDHDARVDLFGRAYVTSVTGSLEDYRVAARWVVRTKAGGTSEEVVSRFADIA